MFAELISPITVRISLTAVFGVFMHDTQIDKSLVIAVKSPTSSERINAEPLKLPSIEQYIHAENTSFNSTLNLNLQVPATQPRNQDDKKYVAGRRLMASSSGSEYSWPSI